LSKGPAGPAAEQPRRAQVHFAVAAPMTRLDVPFRSAWAPVSASPASKVL